MPLLLTATVLAIAWVCALAFGWAAPVGIIGLTAAWAAWDARRHRVRHYQSWLAQRTPTLLALLLGAWVVAFPSYLSLRARIRSGTAEIRPGRSRAQARALLLTSPHGWMDSEISSR